MFDAGRKEHWYNSDKFKRNLNHRNHSLSNLVNNVQKGVIVRNSSIDAYT